jgi:hypothetical protein
MRLSTVILAGVLIGGACAGARLHAAQSNVSHEALAGIWINAPDEENSPGPAEGGEFGGPGSGNSGGARGGHAGAGGGGGGGGRGGRGGGGGGFGGGGGGFGGGRAQQHPNDNESAARAAALSVYERSLMDPVKQMTIVIHDPSVTIVYDDGHTQELTANGKKVNEKAENDYVKLTRKTHWDGAALISEIAISNGPNFQQRYDVVADGTELRVSTTPIRSDNNGGRGGYGGGGGGGGRGLTYGRTAFHVYKRPDITPAASAPVSTTTVTATSPEAK